jgi:SAM-dependent methyltransferase
MNGDASSAMSTDRLRGKWEKYAPRYDRDIGFFERVQFGGGREWVCSQATGDVLEVAVGTGLNLTFYPDGVRLTGLDFSPAMLAQALARAAAVGREIDLREGDAQALPFPDASFDTVVCTLGLCGFPDERAAITEMHRVLRPRRKAAAARPRRQPPPADPFRTVAAGEADRTDAGRLPDPATAAPGGTGRVPRATTGTAQGRHRRTSRRDQAGRRGQLVPSSA